MKKYEVRLTEGAERDLVDIYHYIEEFDSVSSAHHVLDQLLTLTENLSIFPEKGSIPRELQALGIREYRQRYFKPYRVIYRVIEKQIIIYLIADGRRDMASLLSRRLLN